MSKTILIENQEYISVNEFAAAVGYSPQGIYKMIKNPLNPLNSLVKTVKGVKYLPKSSISVISAESVNENSINSLNEDLNPLNNNLNDLNPENEVKTAPDITAEIIEMLKAELEIKNKQIEDLNTRLAETTQALHQAQELTRREQDLNAKNVLMLENQEQKKKRGLFSRIFKGKDNE